MFYRDFAVHRPSDGTSIWIDRFSLEVAAPVSLWKKAGPGTDTDRLSPVRELDSYHDRFVAAVELFSHLHSPSISFFPEKCAAPGIKSIGHLWVKVGAVC